MVTTLYRFSIRKAFLFPLGLLLFLSLTLLAVCVIQGQPRAKILILGFMLLPITALFIESAFRRTVIDDREVTVFKFLRRKSLRFADVTSLETVQVRKRAFLTLSAGDDFQIFSNAYDSFPTLVEVLLARVPPHAVSEETRAMAESPPVKSADIVSCWLGVVLLSLILYIQLGGRF